MTTNLKITINGKEYAASPGQMILDVVRANRVDDIPTLCWDPKLPPYGSCYLCVVEIKGLEKLVPSCSSPVADGMVVETNNDRIRESRKTAPGAAPLEPLRGLSRPPAPRPALQEWMFRDISPSWPWASSRKR